MAETRVREFGYDAWMNTPHSRALDRFIEVLHWAVVVIEVLVALALTALAGGALLALGVDLWTIAASRAPLTHIEFTTTMGQVLQVFILVELFRIAIAYMKHENVIPTVLEATLIAVARKLIVFDSGTSSYLFTALGLAALLIAVAVAWWMLARANACEMATD
jgi:uncharacterized membrane protein (DUF373 family)